MPKWYRLRQQNVDGQLVGRWATINTIYRLRQQNVSGQLVGRWNPIKTIYRLKNNGSWDIVHSSVSVPVATTNPTLTNQNSSTTLFYGGDTLTLTRGEYTNTTTNSDTTYRMRIYKGTDISKPLSDTTSWTAVTTDNFTGANSTSSTTITYALTDADAKAGNYLVGEVRVNNDANTAGSATYDFETAQKVLSRISFTVGALTVTPTHRGGSFSWSVNGINDDSTFIHSQTLTVRLTNSTGAIKVTQSPATTSRNSTVEDSVNISPSTMYYATIEVVANDGWKNTATPNKLTSNVTFNTLSAPPVNTVAPTIGPLNNRGYLPVSTVLTSTQGTWSNVSAGTTYLFDWWKEDSVTNLTTNTGYITNSTQTYSVNDVGDYVFVRVKATNSDGGEGTATSTTYTLDQAVAVGNITPTTTTVNVATNFSFNISHYPTSYVVNWGDGTTDSENIAANTSTVNKTISHTYTSTGTKTVTITAQPGNKTSTTNITVAVPTPTATNIAQSNGTTIPSQPSTITFSSSNNQVTSSWTNGSPITSVTFKGIGAGVNTEYTDTTSPFITSDVSNFSSTGTYTATVTNTNGTLVARVSWNQANAASYRIDFDRSNTGSDVVTNNSSASSVSVDIPWTTLDGTFRVTALTLYSGANQTGVSASYSPGFSAIPIQAQSSTRTNNTSLTAVYTITYNANGGTVTPTSVNVNGGSSVTLPTPTRSGYTFNGWYTASTGGTFVGAAGASYTPTASITLFAQWTLITPTGSGFAQANGTTIPSQPSTITFSSSNNQVTSSWTNGSPITSVRFRATLNSNLLTEYTDASAPFITSDVTNYGVSGTYEATVTNFNNALRASVSWNQTNAQSYTINYSSSVFGANSQSGNASGSSVSAFIDWTSGSGNFTFTGLTLYAGANQTGASTFYSTGLSAISIPERSSTRTNSTSITYTPPPTLPTPTFGTVTRAVGGFSVGISNYDANNSYNVTASSGTASRSGATITVTGLTAGASSTVSVVASRSGYTNSATGQVTGTAANTPSAPQSLSRSGTGLSKTFTWSAPADNNGSAITSYEYSVDGGSSWVPTSSSTSQSYTYSLAGSVSFSVRAVNGVGGGTAASVTFTIPSVSSVTASSITSTGATISWTSSGQSSYSLTGVGPNSPYTGTTATSRAVTGLTAATAYTPTVTVTSSTGDTASASGSFSTTGGNVAPSGGTYTFNPAAPPASGAVSLTITNVSGTPSTFTYSFVWRRATTSGAGNGTGTDRTYQTTALKTTTNISNNFDSLSILSTYNNFWVRVETTVSNGVTPNLTSMQYVYISNAN